MLDIGSGADGGDEQYGEYNFLGHGKSP